MGLSGSNSRRCMAFAGVIPPSVLRGRALSSVATSSSRACEWTDRSVAVPACHQRSCKDSKAPRRCPRSYSAVHGGHGPHGGSCRAHPPDPQTYSRRHSPDKPGCTLQPWNPEAINPGAPYLTWSPEPWTRRPAQESQTRSLARSLCTAGTVRPNEALLVDMGKTDLRSV
jgi:hypothetical protein